MSFCILETVPHPDAVEFQKPLFLNKIRHEAAEHRSVPETEGGCDR